MNDLIVKNVDLFGDSVMAAQDKEGTIWVGVRWVCQGIGMTDGQYKRQIANIQSDLLLKDSGSNLLLNKGSGEREVFCLKLDFVPLWLAKISITEKTKAERPEFVNKLLQYQLKAKDVLAEAFLTNQSTMPTTIQGQIRLIARGYGELHEEVQAIKAEMKSLKDELPILPIEAERITNAVKTKGVHVMGGKSSNAYANRSIVNAVYRDIYGQIYRNFGVRSYKAIRRNQTDKVIVIVDSYEPPVILQDRIDNENAQQRLDV